MRRDRKNLPAYEGVMITDVGSNGKAIAKVEGLVIFTTHVVPGDIVNLQVTKKKDNFCEARVTEVLEKSPDRVEAFCSHFGICGGCKWQYLPYDKQLYHKQRQVVAQLTRIGHLKLPPISPILGSEQNTFYRNKLEFSFSNRRWLTNEEIKHPETVTNANALGFHIPGFFDRVLDIEKCWLQPEPSNGLRNFIRQYALDNALEFFDLKKQKGFLRNIIVRTATTGESMLIAGFYYEDREQRENLLNAVAREFPELTSIVYVINPKGNDTIGDLEIHTFKGRDHIFEEMEGLRFKVGAKSFYQTNPEQAKHLYGITRSFAALTGGETVYDLYTGTGTIALFLASMAKKVIGIEYVKEAIDDAGINARMNNINNTTFYSGDMKDVLNEDFIKKNGAPDVIITDPPRAGMHESVVKAIVAARPGRIVYVSCNPATQARDIALMDHLYEITAVQPVDMFPHTHHVENVVQLNLRQ